MDYLFGVDWTKAFKPDTPLLEIALRGSLMYLMIFAFLRLFKRGAGSVEISDLLVLVLIADAAQNAMSSEYTSIPDGLILVGTILFWSYALDWLTHRSDAFRRLVRSPPLPLIKDGRPLRQNMRRELITMDELMSQLRLQGTEDISEVKSASMESDGGISVVTADEKSQSAPERPTS